MQVECRTWEEMTSALSLVDGLFDDSVWLSVEKTPTGPASEDVQVTVGCVVVTENGSEYLLQFAERAGTNWLDGETHMAGTERADTIRRELSELCAVRKWKILPGVVSA